MTALPTAGAARRPAARLATALAALSAVAAGLLAESSAASAAVPSVALAPVASRAAVPPAIEDLAGYVPAVSCDPHAKAGTTALGELLRTTYPGSSYGIDRTCGTDPLPTSEHYDGRAIDWFRNVRVPAEKADAQAVLAWLFARDAAGNRYANARRLGVMYVIWNNHIWGSYRAAEGWRPYAGCPSRTARAYDTTCHRDHVHLSLSWEGAMRRTSYWTGEVAARDHGPCREPGLNWAAPYTGARTSPCPGHARVVAPAGASPLTRTLTTYSGMVLRRGDVGPVVSAVQQAVGAEADGIFGPLTAAAVAAWQERQGLRGTGVVDGGTWRALLRVAPEPAPSPRTAHPELTRYLGTVLRQGDHRPAVAALQRRLAITADGWFGPRTRASVQRFQRQHHLRATGVVGRRTWRALGA